MKAFFQFIVRSIAAFTATGSAWLISFFAFGQAFLISSGIAIAGGAGTYYGIKYITARRYAKENGLTLQEFRFIDNNLKEAKDKIRRLQRSLYSVGQLGNVRENRELLMTVKSIYTNTKREPRRFFQAEGFYYKHLDSLVEIAEKYAYLSKQPVKSREMNETMRESRHAIIVLGQTVKKDLRVMLNDDVDTLHFELDVARKTIEKPRKRTGG